MRDRRRIGAIVAVAAALLLVVTLVHAAVVRRDRTAVLQADPEGILGNGRLRGIALNAGRKVFARSCAACHGAAGRGNLRLGAPDLADGEQVYATDQVADIEAIVLHGIRSGDPKGWNLASMPAYARPRPYAAEPIPPLRPGEIADVVAYLLGLHGKGRQAAAAARGRAVFVGKGGCYDCHSPDAGGDPAIGAPSLLDDVWLYGDGSAASIGRSIAFGHAGVMPAFRRRLTPFEARAVAVFTRSLSQPPEDHR